MRLVLARRLRAEVARIAREDYPREACGTLIGRRDQRAEGSLVEVLTLTHGDNLNIEARNASAHDRYTLDPAHLVRAEAAACAQGLEVVGIWHTHPDQLAVPSELDRKNAWGGWCYLIASVTSGGEVDLRSWRLDGVRFREERIDESRSDGDAGGEGEALVSAPRGGHEHGE